MMPRTKAIAAVVAVFVHPADHKPDNTESDKQRRDTMQETSRRNVLDQNETGEDGADDTADRGHRVERPCDASSALNGMQVEPDDHRRHHPEQKQGRQEQDRGTDDATRMHAHAEGPRQDALPSALHEDNTKAGTDDGQVYAGCFGIPVNEPAPNQIPGGQGDQGDRNQSRPDHDRGCRNKAPSLGTPAAPTPESPHP